MAPKTKALNIPIVGANGYKPDLEISNAYAGMFPGNCAVIERTADGFSLGACTHYLTDGVTCPRHGAVKVLPVETAGE